MKKIIKIFILGLLFILVGCGNKVKVPADLVGEYNIDYIAKNGKGDTIGTVIGKATVSKKGNTYYVDCIETTNDYEHKFTSYDGPQWKYEYTPRKTPRIISYKFSGEIIKVDGDKDEKIVKIYFDIKDIEASDLKNKLEMQRDPYIFLERKVVPEKNFKNEKELLTILSVKGINFKKIK